MGYIKIEESNEELDDTAAGDVDFSQYDEQTAKVLREMAEEDDVTRAAVKDGTYVAPRPEEFTGYDGFASGGIRVPELDEDPAGE